MYRLASQSQLRPVQCILSSVVSIHRMHHASSLNYVDKKYQQSSKGLRSTHQLWGMDLHSRVHKRSAMLSITRSLSTLKQNNDQTGNTQLLPLSSLHDNMALEELVRKFQVDGHKLAQLDPLRMSSIVRNFDRPHDFLSESYGFNEADLDREFYVPRRTFITDYKEKMILRDIIQRLKKTYCWTIGLEFMHIDCPEKRNWLQQRFEERAQKRLSIEDIKRGVQQLMQASNFEEYLKKKRSSEKRFGLEGCEMLIPAIEMIIDTAVKKGVDTVIMGMAHRGRLNVLANITDKLEEVINEFNSNLEPSDVSKTGDIKYHLGTSTERLSRASGSKVNITLLDNPSHLEAVNALVQGMTRAQQFYRSDKNGDKVMSIQLHGDAAFSGQGVVYEVCNMSELPDYTTHGTIHIVCNNQIGFTTDPYESRSSPYCTDVAKIVNAPIFHVNADDPEAVLYVSMIAAEWRQTFKKDVVIDLVGYRRHGHSEVDEPSFTQPSMYKKIKEQTPVIEKWVNQLIKEGTIEQEWYNAEVIKYDKILENAKKNSNDNTLTNGNYWDSATRKDFVISNSSFSYPTTGISEDILFKIGTKANKIPASYIIHQKLQRICTRHNKMLEQRQVNWPLAESMAIGSVLLDGHHVRLSGQDVERGTFARRHHVLHDQENYSVSYVPMNHLSPTQGYYTICNSPLSEFGALGYELGYSTVNRNSLIIWEAQYGDFANVAQCIIDQFISSGESKWGQKTGIVLLLPHGYTGGGPEHSSARLERFLQMCAEDEDYITELNKNGTNHQYTNFAMYQLDKTNMIVAYPTTPANYFHILRRQLALPFRKPLIIMSPKSPLGPDCSSFDEIINDTSFQRIYAENGSASKKPTQVKKLIFCSGKTYYNLFDERKKLKLESEIAIVRIEQISPFPYDLIRLELEKYSNAKICFAQEEHKNMGAYSFCKPRLITLLRTMNDQRSTEISYAGRDTAAAPATGIKSIHEKQNETYIKQAMTI